MKLKYIITISFCLSTFLFAQYSGGSGSGYGAGTSNVVGVSAFLQGPFSGGVMTIALNTNNFIPLAQPYNAAPWNYTGTESVASIPTGVVDWVLVELRTGTAASTTVQKRACFILNTGSIVDLDGTSPVEFDKTSGNSYYVVIRHRNHLAIMSANALTLSSSLSGSYLTGGSTEYDFSTAQTQAYTSGTNPMTVLIGGGFGMIAGDVNKSNVVTAADISPIISNLNASNYHDADVNMSAIVTAADITPIISNINKATNVPN
jgi:hypothetical protein